MAKAALAETIITLPDTNETTLCLRLTGMVTAHEFTAHFDKPIQTMAERNGWYNLYVYYDPAFKGWSREAADLSFKCISRFSPKAKRLAYVNAPDSRMLMMKMLGPIMQAEIKYFEDAQKDEALAWVLAYEPPA